MYKNINLTPELYNLLTLPYDDVVDEYTKEQIIDLISEAVKSLNL